MNYFYNIICLQIQNIYTLYFLNLLMSSTFTLHQLKKKKNISPLLLLPNVVGIGRLKTASVFYLKSNMWQATSLGNCKLIHHNQENSIYLHYPGLRIKAFHKFMTKLEILVILLDNTPKKVTIIKISKKF